MRFADTLRLMITTEGTLLTFIPTVSAYSFIDLET